MNIAHNLEQAPLKPLFFSYLYPAVLGMLLMSINILVDGIFISHGVGTTALAGVNIAVPIFSVLLSVSLWIGMGGATLFSIALGEGNRVQAHKIFTLSFVTMFVIVTAMIATLLLNLERVGYLFGASEATYPYVEQYLHIILLFGVFYTIENLLSIFIRNDGNPKLAMAGLITTSVLNIIFNYLFIFVLEYGVTGCALATALSTIIGMLVLFTHFFRKNSELKFVRFEFRILDIRQIFMIGFPSFIVESTVAVTMILYNIVFLRYLGDNGVSAYAMVNYLHMVLVTVFLGVGMAIQPLVSYHYGARLLRRLLALLKLGIQTALLLGIVTSAIAAIFPNELIAMFGKSTAEIRSLAAQGFIFFAVGYIFLGINMVLAEFFQSITKIRFATTIMLLRSVILFVPAVFLLPKFFGAQAIWFTFPIVEGLTALLVFMYLKIYPKTLVKSCVAKSEIVIG